MAAVEPLFQPLTIRSRTLRNRIVMSPMTRTHSPGGVPGADVAAYYRRRAAAEVGLIVTEGAGIDHPSALGSGSMGEDNVPFLHGEAALAGWRRVVDAVHAEGGLIVPQLWHMGVMRLAGTGAHPEYPSSRPSGTWGPTAKAMLPPPYLEQQAQPTAPMTDSEIGDVIAAYGRGAADARATGFDGVAVHAAHGYLIDTFFWAETNHRTDRWGGDLKRRAAFGIEVVKAMRAAIGPDLPLLFRWSQWKQQDYGAQLARTPDELGELLGPLADAGVDVFDTSTRILTAPAFAGSDLTLAGWVRKLTGVTTMAVGGVGLSKDLQSSFEGGAVAVDNLAPIVDRFEAGEFDLLAVGRSLLVDPRWALKARAGQPFTSFSPQAYGILT